MKTFRLRNIFLRKPTLRTKKRHNAKNTIKFRRRKTRYTTHKNKHNITHGGSLIDFKKVNLYNVYDQPIKEISYSSPIQWDD
jgi:hypothetical protein